MSRQVVVARDGRSRGPRWRARVLKRRARPRAPPRSLLSSEQTVFPGLGRGRRGRGNPRTRAFRRAFYPQVPDRQWNDWLWQVRNRIRTPEALERMLVLSRAEREILDHGGGHAAVQHHAVLRQPHFARVAGASAAACGRAHRQRVPAVAGRGRRPAGRRGPQPRARAGPPLPGPGAAAGRRTSARRTAATARGRGWWVTAASSPARSRLDGRPGVHPANARRAGRAALRRRPADCSATIAWTGCSASCGRSGTWRSSAWGPRCRPSCRNG